MTVVTVGGEVGGISVYSTGGLLLQYWNAGLMNIVAILMDKVLGRPCTRVTVSSHKHWFSYVTDCKDIALVCALLLRKRNVKKRKNFGYIQQRVKGSLKENSTPCTKTWRHIHERFLDISGCLLQHLINCWFCLVQVLHFKITEWESPCHLKKG